MGNSIKDNGIMEWKMVLECGEVQRETLILVNGNSEKLTGMEFILGLMEIDTKVNLKIV